MRWYVAAGSGKAMLFKINGKGRVAWASPQLPAAKGWPLGLLRVTMRKRRYAFYEVAR
jgi:hypothetical protein